jgi:hypothetical protein
VFKDRKHLSDYIFQLRKGKNDIIDKPIIYEMIDVLQVDFKAMRKLNKWLANGSKKCPFCSWNDDNMIIVDIVNTGNSVTEIYQKCFHLIYDIKIVEFEKANRDIVNRVRSNFRHIIVNWDNWVTHLNKIGSVF